MRNLIVIIAVLLISGVPEISTAKQEVLSSDRSRAATRQARTRLEGSLAARGFVWGSPLFLRVFKDQATIEVWLQKNQAEFELFRSYPICYFSGGLGPKEKVGDRMAPEGFYVLRASSFNPFSAYHLSMNIGFPNLYDRRRGRSGSHLMIHGDCVSVGCLAMTDAGIEDIYSMVEAAILNGQTEVPLHIFPFHLTLTALLRHFRFSANSFWWELRAGYLHFEKHRRPPHIEVIGRSYVVVP